MHLCDLGMASALHEPQVEMGVSQDGMRASFIREEGNRCNQTNYMKYP